jgi:hypothetical protein
MKVLEEKIKEVAQLRDAVDKLKKWKADAMMVWEKEHEKQLSDIVIQSAKLTEAEGKLKAEAVEIFNKTKNKQIAKGVGIRETTSFTYEPELALNWAREHKIAIVPESLDVKKFEKYVASTDTKEVPVTAESAEKITISAEVTFVTINKVPSATLATDLSEYLIGG